MAETKNGIKYPDNYNSVADIPKDLKDMAESIDAQIANKVEKVDGKGLSTNDFTNEYKKKLDGLNNYDDTKIKQDIKDIKDEQETQNDDIDKLKAQKEALEKEVQSLKEDAKLNGLTEDNEGELVHIENSTGSRFNSLEIEGNEKQDTREGYNLYNVKNLEKVAGQTVDEDDFITLEKTVLQDSTSYINAHLKISSLLKPSTNYWLVLEVKENTGIAALVLSQWLSETNSQIQTSVSATKDAINPGIYKYAVTTMDDFTNVKYALRTFASFSANTIGKIVFRVSLLEQEPDLDTFEYEKYGSMPSFDYESPIECVEDNIHLKICNKNILDIEKNATVTKGGMTFTTDKDGVLTINGTATTNIYLRLDNNNIADNDIANWAKRILKKGTYVFSVENLSGQTQDINMSAFIRNGAYGQDYTMLYRFFKYEKAKSKFVLNEDVEGVVYLWIYSGITLNNAKLKFQLELEQEATDIVANEEQNYVIPVQQRMFKQDKFIKINGVWKEMHSFKEAKLSEVSSWTKTDNSQQSDTILRFTTNFSDGKLAKYIRTSPRTFWSDKSECVYLFDAYKKECLAPHNAVAVQLNVFINKNRLLDETVEAFKEYLKNNEIIVYYKLKEPLYLDCTDEQIVVLDKIEQEAHTYSEVTNVYTEDEVGAIIKSNTAVDLKTVINNVVEAQLKQIGG